MRGVGCATFLVIEKYGSWRVHDRFLTSRPPAFAVSGIDVSSYRIMSVSGAPRT